MMQERSKFAAVLLLQRRVFQLQLEQFNELHSLDHEDKTVSSELFVPFHFARRHQNDSQFRLADDFELAVLSCLDSNGRLSQNIKLQEFIIAMTRLTKVDNRLLSLHILTNAMTPDCGKAFVELGGLRLLKRWIKAAEEAGSSEELRQLVLVCKSLPFNEKIVKETEIGKSIKKLLKFRTGDGSHDSSVASLQNEVKLLMESWMSLLKEASGGTIKESTLPQQGNDGISSTASVQRLLKSLTKHVSPVMSLLAPPPPSLSPRPSAAVEAVSSPRLPLGHDEEKSQKLQAPMPMQTNPASSQAAAVTEAVSRPRVVKNLVPHTPQQSQAHSTKLLKPEVNKDGSIGPLVSVHHVSPADVIKEVSTVPESPTTGGNSSLDSPRTSTPRSKDGNSRRQAANDRMVEGARKLLAASAVVAEKAATAGGTPMAVGGASSAVIESEISPSPSEVHVPLKSSLKRKNGEESDGSGERGKDSKRRKLSVVWIDESSGGTQPLKQVHTFEVEKFKSSIATYRSHKDLVKRERQLEKETITHKIGDAMQPTMSWSRPTGRVIPFELQDYLPTEVESPERDAQTKRIAHVLEARYLEDSMIPSDPDMIPRKSQFEDTIAVSSPIEVSWKLVSGEDSEEDSSDANELDPEIAELFRSLPECLRKLDEEMLMLLVQDESKLMSILNTDGTVNEAKVSHLRQSMAMQPYLKPSQHFDNMERYEYSTRLQHQQQKQEFAGTRLDGQRGRVPGSGIEFGSKYSSGRAAGSGGGGGSAPVRMTHLPGDLDEFGRPYELPPGLPAMPTFTAHSNAQQLNKKKQLQPAAQSSTRCRFFNTPKGCSFGNKCAFGHFLDEPTVGRGIPPPAGPSAMGNRSGFGSLDPLKFDQFGRDLRY